MNTNRDLYSVLTSVIRNGDILPTTEIDKHVAKLFQFDFEQSGIHLPEEQRHKVVTLNNNILSLGQQFMLGTSTQRAINKYLVPPEVQNM